MKDKVDTFKKKKKNHMVSASHPKLKIPRTNFSADSIIVPLLLSEDGYRRSKNGKMRIILNQYNL